MSESAINHRLTRRGRRHAASALFAGVLGLAGLAVSNDAPVSADTTTTCTSTTATTTTVATRATTTTAASGETSCQGDSGGPLVVTKGTGK